MAKTKKLISLADHNAKAYRAVGNSMKPCPNGIACPMCGSELYDSSPNVMLTSHPPQKHTHCENCDYRGYRIC